DAARDHPRRAGEELVVGGDTGTHAHGRGAAGRDATVGIAERDHAGPRPAVRSANQRVKYVTIRSAPARFTAVSCSSATESWSIQPLADAAFTIAYSPLTW